MLLIQESVTYHQLGLVIIDEQHRFGVGQRRILREKGNNPDVLMMTATPDSEDTLRSLPLAIWMCRLLIKCQRGVSRLSLAGSSTSS